jgi:DNA-binding transcriptional LysR family regulator
VLELKRLMIFCEVVRHSSFSNAAYALSYSQPAVSHHVSRLEQELNVKLLERSSRGDVKPTEAGRALLARAEALLADAANAEAEVAEIAGNRETRVRLASFATGAATILADAIALACARTLGLQLTFREAETPEAVGALKTRNVDVALIFDDMMHPLAREDHVEYRYIYDDPLLLALPRGHRCSLQPVVQLSDLAEDSWIEGAGDDTACSLILAKACEQAGFEPNVVLNSGNYEIVQRLVASKVGVALVPELALTSPDPGIVLRRLQPEPRRRVVLALNRSAYRSAATKAMILAIEDTCEKYAAGRDERLDAVVTA